MFKIEALKIVTEACHKDNPDIKKLEFGCRFKSHGLKILRLSEIVDDNRGFKRYHYGSGGYIREEQLKEILGRPIQLADVLMAIKKLKYFNYGILADGSIAEQDGFEVTDTGLKWNLKEPLENQSKETLVFLAYLLKNKLR